MSRPLKYKNAKVLQKKIDAYFNYCDENLKPYTVSGLAVYLETSRDILIDYDKRDEFSNTIKAAKQRIQAFAEECLFDRSMPTAGVIFSLKNNYGWRDKSETELIGNVDHNHSVSFYDIMKTLKEVRNSNDE